MRQTHRTLRSRIIVGFVGFATAVAAIFGFSTTVLLYSTEDVFFNALLGEEATHLEASFAQRGQWVPPRHGWMSVHQTTATMPADLRTQVHGTIGRREFRGDAGRHYHLRTLHGASADDPRATAWLVGEVSSRLVIRPMRAELVQQWMVIELVILAVAIALAIRMAGRIAQPLSALAETVRRLDPARPSMPIGLTGADAEVALVAGAFNDMRERVDAFVAREQAFTRDTSHELRTPLSVIRSTTAQALHDPALSPAARRLLGLALQSAEHMERTVASLLTLTREGAIDMTATACQVRPILEDVVVELSAALDERALELCIAVPRTAVLPVSEVVLHLLLSNMLGNAVVHAAHGPIHIDFEEQRLTVSNPVCGESVPSLATLGVPGVKGEASRGHGLGLSILRRLCEHAGLQAEWQVREGRFEVTIADAGHTDTDERAAA